MFVFRGHSNIQLSQILAAVGGTHDNVNIFDSAGGTLTASGGKLTVLDTAVVSAINNLPTSGLATAANQATEISILNALPTSGLATTANQISQISLESTLNGIVATKTNQNTEIALLQSLDANVKQVRINYVVNYQSTSYNYVPLLDLTLMSTVLPGLTIASNQVGILSSGPGGGVYTGSDTSFYGAIARSNGNIIYGVTRKGCFIDSFAYNNFYLYSSANTWNLYIYNKSDLIL